MAEENNIEEEIKVEKPEVKYNRASRRGMNKNIHHNVFTKKYKDKKSLETAWLNFLGNEQFAILKRKIKEEKRKLKREKQDAKLKKLEYKDEKNNAR